MLNRFRQSLAGGRSLFGRLAGLANELVNSALSVFIAAAAGALMLADQAVDLLALGITTVSDMPMLASQVATGLLALVGIRGGIGARTYLVVFVVLVVGGLALRRAGE